MATIFVSIASYRDPQLVPTIKDLIKNCSSQNRLKICIGRQFAEEDTWDTIEDLKDPRISIINVPYKESKGVCWMRSEIQKQYNGEDYYFQLDSHHRFIKGWDKTLIKWVKDLKKKGHLKPIISSYLPEFNPDNDPGSRLQQVWFPNIDRFMLEGAIFLGTINLDKYEILNEPFLGRFLSAHFLFTLGEFVKEVPYDPELYFHGEETSLAARSYTFGYDIFHPHRPIAWHEYFGQKRKKNWDDDPEWVQKDKASYARYRKLMGMDPGCTSCQRKALAPYYFGKVRTFQQFERFAGIKFATRQIHEETLKNEFPPIKGDYESGLQYQQKHIINLLRTQLPYDDYNVIVVAFLDERGEDLYRQDMPEEEIKSMLALNPTNPFVHIWRTFNSTIKPHKYRVWPHSVSHGWQERIEETIVYE